MGLRDDLIEAGAPHLVEFFERFCDDAPLWPDVGEAAPFAEIVLDAFLDVLADRADETIHPKYNDWVQPTRLEDASVEDLIAVLRSDYLTEEE